MSHSGLRVHPHPPASSSSGRVTLSPVRLPNGRMGSLQKKRSQGGSCDSSLSGIRSESLTQTCISRDLVTLAAFTQNSNLWETIPTCVPLCLSRPWLHWWLVTPSSYFTSSRVVQFLSVFTILTFVWEKLKPWICCSLVVAGCQFPGGSFGTCEALCFNAKRLQLAPDGCVVSCVQSSWQTETNWKMATLFFFISLMFCCL